MGKTCKYVTREDVVRYNRRMIDQSGGTFNQPENLINPGSLDNALDAIRGSMFGYDQFPTVIDKAAALGFRIITRHVFHDGNKRMGMICSLAFLLLNELRYRKDPPVTEDDIIDVSLQVASNQIDEEGFTKWVRDRVV